MRKATGILAMFVLVLALNVSTVSAKGYVMGVAHLGQVGDVLDQGAKKWGELVEQNSGGKIKVKYYPAEQTGKEADIVSSMQMGSVEGSILGPTIFQQAAPEYNIWSVYYLFSDSSQAMALQNTEVGERCRAAVLKNKGVRIVGYGMRGPPVFNLQPSYSHPRGLQGVEDPYPFAAYLRGFMGETRRHPDPFGFRRSLHLLEDGSGRRSGESPHAYRQCSF